MFLPTEGGQPSRPPSLDAETHTTESANGDSNTAESFTSNPAVAALSISEQSSASFDTPHLNRLPPIFPTEEQSQVKHNTHTTTENEPSNRVSSASPEKVSGSSGLPAGEGAASSTVHRSAAALNVEEPRARTAHGYPGGENGRFDPSEPFGSEQGGVNHAGLKKDGQDLPNMVTASADDKTAYPHAPAPPSLSIDNPSDLLTYVGHAGPGQEPGPSTGSEIESPGWRSDEKDLSSPSEIIEKFSNSSSYEPALQEVAEEEPSPTGGTSKLRDKQRKLMRTVVTLNTAMRIVTSVLTEDQKQVLANKVRSRLQAKNALADDSADNVLAGLTNIQRNVNKEEQKTHEAWTQTRDETTSSLGVFSSHNFFRIWCTQVVKSERFNQLVIGAILLGTLNQLIQQLYIDSGTSKNRVILDATDYFEYGFTGIFFIEMVLKVVSFGLILDSKQAYLRNFWNLIDFAVVILGINTIVHDLVLNEDDSPALQSLRLVRCLRPLILTKRFNRVHVILLTIGASRHRLLQVLKLVVMFAAIYGVIGVILFQGKLKNRCVFDNEMVGMINAVENATSDSAESLVDTLLLDFSEDNAGKEAGIPYGYTTTTSGEFLKIVRAQAGDYGEFMMCGADKPTPLWDVTVGCPISEGEPLHCRPVGTNPNAGLVGFDNILGAMLTVFQCMMLEGWTDTLYMLMDVSGYPAIVYILISVLLGALFIVNVAIAVLFDAYTAEETARENREEMARILNKEMEAQAALREEERRKAKKELTPYQHMRSKHRWKKGVKNRSMLKRMDEEAEETRAQKVRRKSKHYLDYVTGPMFGRNKVKDDNGESESDGERISRSEYNRGEHSAKYGESRNGDQESVGIEGEDADYSEGGSDGEEGEVPIRRTRWKAKLLAATRWKAKLRHHVVDRKMRTFFGAPNQRLEWWKQLLAEESLFDVLMMLVVVINCITMLTVHFQMSDLHVTIVQWVNDVCCIIMLVDTTLKVLLMGPRQWASDVYNLLDGASVVLVICEWIIRDSFGAASLRALRMLRFFRLARGWKELQIFLDALSHGVRAMAPCCMLLLLFTFSFASIGQTIFSGTFDFPDGRPPLHFDTFYDSFITVFVVVSGENWNEIMENGVRAVGWSAITYFIPLFCLGLLLLWNLTTAMLIYAFGKSHSEKLSNFQEKANLRASYRKKLVRFVRKIKRVNVMLEHQMHEHCLEFTKLWLAKQEDNYSQLKLLDASYIAPPMVLTGRSLRLFGPDNKFRRVLHRVVSNNIFEYVIMTMITVGCVTLTINDGRSISPHTMNIIHIIENINAALFLTECVMKVIVMGFWRGEHSYLRDPFNVVDFLAVVVSILTFAGVRDIKALKALRAIRPLRLLSKSISLRLVVKTLGRSVKMSIHPLLLSLVVFIIFSAMGVQLFKGSFYWCTDSAVTKKEECVGPFEADSGDVFERQWVPATGYNFDSVPNALVTLFEVTTLEMWPDIMVTAMAAVGEHDAPAPGYSPEVSLYFMVFVLLSNMIVLNLVTSIIVDTYTELTRARIIGSEGSNTTQMAWVNLSTYMEGVSPQVMHMPLNNKLSKRLYRILNDPKYTTFIDVFNVLNCAVAMIMFEGQSKAFEEFDNIVTLASAFVFPIDVILGMLCYGVVTYLSSKWHWFDLTVAAIAVQAVFTGVSASFLRVLKLGRTLMLLRVGRSMFIMIRAMFSSMTKLGSVFAVLLLIIFVYSIAGNALFHTVSFQSFLNRHANFTTFPRSALTLIRCLTGESFNGLMHDLAGGSLTTCGYPSQEDPGGPPLDQTCGPHAIITVTFFLSFIFISQFALLNLVLAVIMDNFQMARLEENTTVSALDVDHFVSKWAEFDPNATSFLSVSQVYVLLQKIPAPLGFAMDRQVKTSAGISGDDGEDMNMNVSGGQTGKSQGLLMGFLEMPDLPLYSKGVKFLDILTYMSLRAFLREIVPGDPYDQHVKSWLMNRFRVRSSVIPKKGDIVDSLAQHVVMKEKRMSLVDKVVFPDLTPTNVSAWVTMLLSTCWARTVAYFGAQPEEASSSDDIPPVYLDMTRFLGLLSTPLNISHLKVAPLTFKETLAGQLIWATWLSYKARREVEAEIRRRKYKNVMIDFSQEAAKEEHESKMAKAMARVSFRAGVKPKSTVKITQKRKTRATIAPTSIISRMYAEEEQEKMHLAAVSESIEEAQQFESSEGAPSRIGNAQKEKGESMSPQAKNKAVLLEPLGVGKTASTRLGAQGEASSSCQRGGDFVRPSGDGMATIDLAGQHRESLEKVDKAV